MNDDFESRILEKIGERSLIADGDTGIVAVSGGADSVCLLHILDRFGRDHGLRLKVVHVHHGIRGKEADRDADFAAGLAAGLGLPCRVVYTDIPKLAKEQGMSLEEAGRLERYRILREEKEKEGAAWIALAHHLDDRVETVIFNMLRGSGLRGLRGILPLQGDLIRPLISVERSEIESWLRTRDISWCEDSTNLDTDYTRNRIRHRIIPEMLKVNAGAKEHILRLAEDAERRYEVVRAEAAALLGEAEVSGTDIFISDTVYEGCTSPDVKEELLLQALGMLAGRRKDISEKHIRILQELRENETGKRVSLPYGLEGIRSYNGLLVRKREDAEEKGEVRSQRLRILRRAYIPGEELPRDERTVMVDADSLHGEPVLRTPKEDDRIVIDSAGHTKPLKRFFTDRKVAAHLRDSWPVVSDDNGVLWIVGLRLGEHCKIKESTRKTVILSVAEETEEGGGPWT